MLAVDRVLNAACDYAKARAEQKVASEVYSDAVAAEAAARRALLAAEGVMDAAHAKLLEVSAAL